jgi:hypothetical protein
MNSRQRYKAEQKAIEEGWGQPISMYTREDAIEDGVLFDISDLAKEAGFKIPVAITAGVKTLCTPDKDAEAHGQSYNGRLWDVLAVARFNALKEQNTDTIYFQVKIQQATVENVYDRDYKLWMKITPEGKNYQPVLTIMMQGED